MYNYDIRQQRNSEIFEVMLSRMHRQMQDVQNNHSK